LFVVVHNYIVLLLINKYIVIFKWLYYKITRKSTNNYDSKKYAASKFKIF